MSIEVGSRIVLETVSEDGHHAYRVYRVMAILPPDKVDEVECAALHSEITEKTTEHVRNTRKVTLQREAEGEERLRKEAFRQSVRTMPESEGFLRRMVRKWQGDSADHS